MPSPSGLSSSDDIIMREHAPIAVKHTTMDVPPEETNGRGTPITGKSLSTTRIFTKACTLSQLTTHKSTKR